MWLTSAVFLFASLAALTGAGVIPDSFLYRNVSQYTARYLSEAGQDSSSCLDDQGYPTPANSIEYCRTLTFALTGSYDFSSENLTRILVFALPGNYAFGATGIRVYRSNHMVLSRLPGEEGEVVFSCSSFDEFSYNNMYYYESSYIALNDVVFTGCGRQSTALATLSVRNLVLSNTIFRDNLNSGLLSHESEDLLIINSVFHDNNSTAFYNNTRTLDPGGFRLAGGLVISWNSTSERSTTVIRNCTFVNNHANINELNGDDNRPNIYRPRGHGGAIVVSFENTTNHTLVIEDSQVSNNTALFNGGGMFISLYKDSIGNDIVITDSTFEDNTCVHTGGAISMNTFEIANDNTLTVKNTTFRRNSAWVGGGAYSLTLQDNLVPKDALLVANVASFSSCSFTNNTSPTGGSAISLVSNLGVNQVVANTNFSNCTFVGNRGMNQSAIYSFKFPITLDGSCVFKGNMGGALSLLQSRVDVRGSAVFTDNIARMGGAMTLEDQSIIHLLSGSEVSFVRNHAEVQGGAVSVRAPTVGLDTDIVRLFNTRCFIQYEFGNAPSSLDPAEWRTSMTFINNTAEVDGAAIYAIDIQQCLYAPSLTSSNSSSPFELSIFQLSNQFTFSGNRVLNPSARRNTETLATSPFKLAIEPQSIAGAPGESIDVKVGALDQGGNWQAAVWSLAESDEYVKENSTSEDEGQSEVKRFFALPAGGNNHTYEIAAIDVDRYDNCSSGLKRSLNFSLVQVLAGDIVSVSTVGVNLTCCHPGYLLSADGVCVHNHDNQNIVRSDPRRHYIYVQPDIYAEVREGKIITAIIPTPFQNCTREGTLPGCLFKFDNPEEQCSQRRTGFLCGRCPEGESVDLTLRHCKKCTVGDAIAVAVIVIVFFLASLLVLFFNVGIPNELKGCLFFVQVVGFVYETSDGTSWDFHLSRVFGFSLYLPLCPYPGYSALGTAAYGILLSLLAIATLIIYVISARFSRVLSHRNSFEGIWLLSIITYKYTADTCFNLLRCQKVSGEGIAGEFVYYYDGSVRCFHSSHLGVSIVAFVLGVVVVLLFPVLIFVISFRTFKHTQPFTDVLTNGIKVSCRWWSGFDLLRRLFFIIVVFFFSYVQPSYTQFALLITGLIIFTTFACSKPYDGKWSNLIEAAVLFDLLALTALFLNTDVKHRQAVHPLALILLLLPFISIALYIIIGAVISIWKKVSPTSFMLLCKKVQGLLQGKILVLNRKRKSVSHTLDITSLDQPLIEEDTEDTDDAMDLQVDYSVYREELLDDN